MRDFRNLRIANLVLFAFTCAGCSYGTSILTKPLASSSISAVALPQTASARRVSIDKLPMMPATIHGSGYERVPTWRPHTSYLIPQNGKPCIYLPEHYYGEVYVYSSNLIQIGQISALSHYGWGLATHDQRVYIGTFLDTIDEYTACSGTSPVTTLTGVGNGYPYGVAVAPDGTVYADEFPTNIIDFWAKGKHGHSRDPGDVEIYFLAVDKEGDVFNLGYDGNGVSVLDECKVRVTQCVRKVAWGGSNSLFPGGLAFDSSDNLYVLDQGGTLREFAGCATGDCKLIGSKSETLSNELIGIALDTRDHHVLSAEDWNEYSCPQNLYLDCADSIELSLPLSNSQIVGQTSLVNPGLFYGVAYWPPSGL